MGVVAVTVNVFILVQFIISKSNPQILSIGLFEINGVPNWQISVVSVTPAILHVTTSDAIHSFVIIWWRMNKFMHSPLCTRYEPKCVIHKHGNIHVFYSDRFKCHVHSDEFVLVSKHKCMLNINNAPRTWPICVSYIRFCVACAISNGHDLERNKCKVLYIKYIII